VKLSGDITSRLRAFHAQSDFAHKGGIITDLDGTALLEEDGRLFVELQVEAGLKALIDSRRPVAINTLRFPLNIINSFGRTWSAITSAPVPVLSLNGAFFGYLKPKGEQEVEFEEAVSCPLAADHIESVLAEVATMLDRGIGDILVFHYPCDWRLGERIWTPHPHKVDEVRRRYGSASSVEAGEIEMLAGALRADGACMLLILAEVPDDKCMAYQHANPNRFITAPGIDKLSGARLAAQRLGFDLAHSVGAGDTPMDTFLSGVGLALHVGPLELGFRGLVDTIRLPDPGALGAALFELSSLQLLAQT
jgi:hydroxymethylpyrimidine pyrophosphatase-like HAD family hydrolase